MKNETKKRILAFSMTTIIALSLFSIPILAHAAGPLESLFPEDESSSSLGACYKTGNYSLYHIIKLIYGIMQWVWGLSGSLALLMFVWGGVLWLISAGAEEKIKEGKTTLINAVIGIIIIFGSWMLINYVVGTLVSGSGTQQAKIFGDPWNDYKDPTGEGYDDKGCLTIKSLQEQGLLGKAICQSKEDAETACKRCVDDKGVPRKGSLTECDVKKEGDQKEWRCWCIDPDMVHGPK